MNIRIRPESASDLNAIRRVHEAAFPNHAEARLVELLRAHGKARVSLVAEVAGEIAGHVLFSPVTIGAVRGIGLAPLAVLPAFQRKGIGKALVNAGLDECRKLGLPWCVVLGDPGYYRLFGFELAKPRGIGNEYNADEHFMLIELAAGSLPPSGVAKYAPEFAEVGE